MATKNSTTKEARKPSKATQGLTPAQWVTCIVARFGAYMDADATLQNVKALYDAARLELRIDLQAAHKEIGDGRPWDVFKKQLRMGLVRAGVCNTSAAAGRLINNAVIALGLTGKGTNGKKKNGKKKDGAGRPEDDGVMGGKHVPAQDVALRLAAVLHYVAEAQAKHAGDSEVLDILADIAAIAGGKVKREAKNRALIAKALRI